MEEPVTEILTEKQLKVFYGKSEVEETPLKEKIKKSLSCNEKKAKRVLLDFLPIIGWISTYNVRKILFGDIMSGLTVGIVNLPQAMAYASLAAMPAINGLYVSFFPPLLYALFGSSRHISVGTFAIVSIMVGNAIEQRVPENYCDSFSNSSSNQSTLLSNSSLNGTLSGCDVNDERTKYAVAISMAIGLIFLLLYILQLGFVTAYLSSHMVRGFTCGGSFHVLMSQLPKLLGITFLRQTGIGSNVKNLIKIFENIKESNPATCILSAIGILFLIMGKEINLRFKKKLPFPIPWELFIIIVCAIASHFGKFEEKFDVIVIGNIETGLKTTIPNFDIVGSVLAESVAIAIVSYAVTISLAKMFANKHAYDINSNQELFAFSIIGMISAFFACFPAASSLSRSVIQDESGGKTQLAAVVSSIFILIVLLWIGPLFENLPRAALAVIIIVNLKSLLIQFNQLPNLWKISKIDAVIWTTTCLCVIFLGVDIGLLIGIFVSIFSITLRTQRVVGDVIVPVTSQRIYRSSKLFDDEKVRDIEEEKKIIMFSFKSAIYFANKDSFRNQVTKALGFDPVKEIARRKQEDKKADPEPLKSYYDNKAMKVTVEEDISKEKVAEEEDCSKDEIKVKCLILDMGCCPFLDNDGSKAVLELFNELRELDISFLLAGCIKNVQSTLYYAGLKDELEKENPIDIFFVSLEAARIFALRMLEDKNAPSQHLIEE